MRSKNTILGEKENINLDMILGDEFLWQKTEK